MTELIETDAPVEPADVRAMFVAWLAGSWDPDLSLVEWRHLLMSSGWAAPAWPTRWHGLGLPSWSSEIVADELAQARAVGIPPGAGTGLVGPTMLEWGSDGLCERFLGPLLTGEETWCQLFSEPGAGSDLAGLTTTARLDGDEWIVNGQKVWNTSAHHADFGILIARTNWDLPKHRGLTYFILPMRQPGVEVRPLRQMNGYSSFNQVFLSDARIPHENVVGKVGNGWSVALTTLAFERRFFTMARPKFPQTDQKVYREAETEAEAHFSTYRWYPQRAGRIDLLVERAKSLGCSDDPIIRQELVRVLTLQRVSQWTAQRAAAARALGRAPGAEGSLGKLASSETARQAARVHAMIGGADGMLSGPSGQLDGVIAEVLISYPAQSIAGGTDQIQKNILAEKVLGLPREQASDRNMPFRDVPRNG